MIGTNLYQLIGVTSDASIDEIRMACDEALQSDIEHNDKVVIRHARETLCNPLTRAVYDQSLQTSTATSLDRSVTIETGSSRSTLPYVVLVTLLAGAVWYGTQTEKSALKPGPSNQETLAVAQEPSKTNESSGNRTVSQGLYADVSPSVMLIVSLGPNDLPIATGSGVVVAPQTVVTNCHVVVTTANVVVRNGDVDYPAISRTSDRQLDLCLLSVPNLATDAAKLGSVGNLRVGDAVYAIGAPHGMQRTLTQGVVSALQESPDGPVIQSTAVIAPGSSGGGLFTADGRLVGITTAQSKASNTINFAVPIDWLDKLQSR